MIISQIIRSKRKTIALIIQHDGSLIIRAPLHVSQKHILEFVHQKSNWIRKKQAFLKANYALSTPKQYRTGEEFWYLGKKYPLEIVDTTSVPKKEKQPGKAKALRFYNGRFYLSAIAQSRAQQLFKTWYREQALTIINQRVEWYARRCGFTYTKIRITSAQTRWGSCSTKGVLSFTWRLAMAPIEIIDCIVVHELVHTIERNHRKGFWDRVKAILPDYKTRIRWLEINSGLLRL
ncbi:MAG: M48 family metallopeptidase [Anaerolineae bacterium]|nr:M48 family metallopeptidase [Anaerolineae bacterium]